MSTTKEGLKNIAVVTGDVTMDWNIAGTRSGKAGGSGWTSEGCTRAYWQRGGALRLADLVETVGKQIQSNEDANWEVRQTAASKRRIRPSDEGYHHSFAMWSPSKYGLKSPLDKEKPAWRVEEFLGLDRQDDRSGKAAWKKVVNDSPDAGLIVLDDAGLGFRDCPEFWPESIMSDRQGPPPWILLKMAKPVAQGPLWEHLHANSADRLIVLMTINDLRLTEVQISRELSWERTAQDLVWELVHNPRINALSHCAHVVVSFDTAGAVLLSRLNDEVSPRGAIRHEGRLFFDPRVVEGMWNQRYPGGMIGYTSCLAAGLARQIMLSPDKPDIKEGIEITLFFSFLPGKGLAFNQMYF